MMTRMTDMYVIVLMDPDTGYFDPELNDVIGTFKSEADAKAWAIEHVSGREFSVENLASPRGYVATQ
jgi:hypothetical protein